MARGIGCAAWLADGADGGEDVADAAAVSFGESFEAGPRLEETGVRHFRKGVLGELSCGCFDDLAALDGHEHVTGYFEVNADAGGV